MKKPTKPQRRLKCPRGFTMKQAKFNRIFYHKFANVDDVIKRNYQNMDETDLRVLLWVRRQARFKLQKYLMEGVHVKPRFR